MYRYGCKCRSRYRSMSNNFEITRREILFSIIILLAMICLGFFIENSISNNISESNEVYYRATKIDNNSDQFKYGIKTNIGNTLVYGEFNAINSITIPELTGQYFAIEKETQRYTRHTRTVTSTDSKGNTKTKTEVYYSWDNINTDRQMVDKFSFLDCEFSISKIRLSNYGRLSLNDKIVSDEYASWIRGDYLYKDGDKWANVGDLRYKYDVVQKSFKGSILAKLKDNSIYNINNDNKSIDVLHNKTIAQVIKSKQDSESRATVVFWVAWMILTIGAIIGFVYLDNYWLEDSK